MKRFWTVISTTTKQQTVVHQDSPEQAALVGAKKLGFRFERHIPNLVLKNDWVWSVFYQPKSGERVFLGTVQVK